MKIASFNVNSIRARLPIVLNWLKEESPDVLCVQETKVVDEDFPKAPFAEMGYHVACRGQKSYNGVAIISRHPLEKVSYGFDDRQTYGSRLIAASVKRVPIVNTYVPQGYEPSSEKFREKLEWFERLIRYFDQHYSPKKALIWTGDFNVAPETIDVYDPEKLMGQVGFHPDERALLKQCRDWGFVDVFRRHQPGPEQFTFWDYRIRGGVKNNRGWRIDHIWATPPLAKKSVKSWIDIRPRLMEKPSDHTPVVAEFDL